MKLTLPESKRSSKRRTGGVGVSVALHVVVLGAAVVTAARPEAVPTREEQTIVVYQRPKDPEPVHRVVEPTQRSAISAQPASEAIPPLEAPRVIIDRLPEIGTTSTFDPGRFERRADAIAGVPVPDRPSVPADGIFDHESVERAVVPLTGNPVPRYPSMLQSAGVEGTVVVQFVVDTTGRVERGSARAVRSDHVMFERAVLDVLSRMKFAPAEVDGRKVRQLVEQAFGFVRK
jgi:protein TonB